MRGQRRFLLVFLLLVSIGLGALGAKWLYEVTVDLPEPQQALSARPVLPSIRIVDRQGRLLYEALPDDARYTPLPPDRIPRCLKDATIAVEDASFYRNPGVDWRGVLRALWLNLRYRRVVAGGSTITQQVARNLLLSPTERRQRTLTRKLRETLLAWRLNRRLSKDQILALYLNTTYYGGFAYGVEAAAQTFFGKSAADLTLPECALLAGLPQAPTAYDPFLHPEAARARQKAVLDLMVRHGFIDAATRDRALSVPLAFNSAPYPMHAPHFAWMALQRIRALQEQGRLPRDVPLEVRTTLDLDVQRLAEDAVRRHLERLQQERARNVNNAAVVVLDATTGALRALVGSANYQGETIRGAINMATTPRPTGSAFKPIIYAAALQPDQPEPWTEATVLWDVRTTFHTRDGQPYRPENYDRREHGPVTLRQALASSLNIPAVLTLQKVGVGAALRYARRLGIANLGKAEKYDLSLALGGGEVSLLALTTAYDAFANQGIFLPYWWLYEVADAGNGKTLYRPPRPSPRPVWDPRVAWLISDILSDDRARSLGFPRHTSLEMGFPAAVKTGTSSAFHDNWTIGYTTRWVVGVWVGNADFQAMHQVDGLTGAAPIWHTLLQALSSPASTAGFPRPAGLRRVTVCTLSGLLPTPACRQTHPAWFIEGTEPTEPDDTYHLLEIDAATGRLAGPDTPATRRQTIVAFELPPRAWGWARAHGWPLVQDFAPPAPHAGHVFLRHPADGSVYRIAPDLPAAAQQIQVLAETDLSGGRLRLWVDGHLLTQCAAATCQGWWPLQAGLHRFWADVVFAADDAPAARSPAAQVEVEAAENP